MFKRILTLLLVLCLAISLGIAALAGESESIDVIVNDSAIVLDIPVQAEEGTTYVSALPVVQALYPSADVALTGNGLTVSCAELTLSIDLSLPYVVANGRYFYLPNAVRVHESGALLLPSRTLALLLGASVAWDPLGSDVVFTSGETPLASGETIYDADDLYWLSHIINAESGNQPLTGKIAVGNVVMNRAADPSRSFPNTIKGVIFQKNQFSPAASGSVYKDPNDESVIAAKLCLEGANVVGNALYFHNPRIARNSWAARNRSYVATIGGHAFYA